MTDGTDPAAKMVEHREAILAACREAWRRGYQQAIDSTRELAASLDSDDTRESVEVLCSLLEKMKP
jgi:hypothetical protein